MLLGEFFSRFRDYVSINTSTQLGFTILNTEGKRKCHLELMLLLDWP